MPSDARPPADQHARDRELRRAAQLRANLKRRKAQGRARDAEATQQAEPAADSHDDLPLPR